MTTQTVACRSDATLADAAKLMWDRDIGFLPVIDERERVVGIVTDRDVCMAAYFQGRPLADIPVQVAMSRDVHCCTSRESVTDVEHRMSQHQIRRVPVIDDERCLIGVVSLGDLARACVVGRGVAPNAVASVLAAIGERRPDLVV